MSDLVPIPKRATADSPHTSRDIPAAFVPIEQLLPYARNARTHSDAQVAQIAASIIEWGWTNPILADAKGIVAGHGRLAAARLLYSQGRVITLPSGEDVPTGCVPCIDVSGWTDTARRAYVLADNQLALQAGWDDSMLTEELRSIRDDGFDISLTGFDDAWLSDMLDDEPVGDADAIPEEPVAPRCAPGDLFLLGKHRVMCGSATDASDVAALLAGVTPQLVFTDPPYELATDDVLAALLLTGAQHFVVICTFLQAAEMYSRRALRFCFDFVLDCVLPKHMGNMHAPFYTHQNGVYFCVNGAETIFDCANAIGVRSDASYWATIIHSPRKTAGALHKHQKNAQAITEALCGFGATEVVDMFAGSGTTLIAAEQLKKVCYAMELSPAHCDVIVKRWQDYTGKKAHRSDGVAFDDIVPA